MEAVRQVSFTQPVFAIDEDDEQWDFPEVPQEGEPSGFKDKLLTFPLIFQNNFTL